MRIGLTGATGFIGKLFGNLAVAHGHEVIAYTRSPQKAVLPWCKEVRALDVDASLPLDASGLDVLVHLAGESVLGYWTAKKKARIRDSRVELTQKITRCLANPATRPAALLCASGTGFYGDRGDEPLDEGSSRGDDFLSQVCVDWEASAQRAEQLGMRVVRLRTGMVLGDEGGAWPLLKTVFDNYLGGRLGSGRQWVPWIHVSDEVRLILWAAEHPEISGQVNLVSPNPVTNADFTRAIAKALERPAFMHAPAFALKLLLGEFSGALLGSQRVLPKMALAHGFQFDHPTLESALTSLTAK
jgi:hypothetical protein